MIGQGIVTSASAAVAEARLPLASVGDGVRITTAIGRAICGTVFSVSHGVVGISPFGNTAGVAAGDAVQHDATVMHAPLGLSALGRAFDAAGDPIDAKDRKVIRRALHAQAPLPHFRSAVRRPLWTGVCALDGLLTIGIGARIGIFGAAGAGKSTLLLSLAQNAAVDAVVIGLVGERGREAETWIAALPDHATIYCATSDRAAGERVQAARIAMAQAAELRSRGLDVLLILDSLARYAAAHREIAIAAGDRAGRGGFPPRVFAELAAFCEIAGNAGGGSVTLVATVLNDGDDRDPVSEAARALLDGHVQLSSELAGAGMFPAIDILGSVSRTMNDVVSDEHRHDAALLRSAIAELERTREARAVGIVTAEDSVLRALALNDRINAFLYGKRTCAPSEMLSELHELSTALSESQWNFQRA